MQALSPAIALPAPRQVLLETPFWLTLLAAALIPGSVAPWVEWDGIPVRAIELAVVAAAALYLACSVPRRLSGAPAGAWKAALPFLAGAGYAAIAFLWTGLDTQDAPAMGLTLVFAVAAPVLAASLIDSLPRAGLEDFLWRFTIFLAAVSALYAAESILSLGLRGEASRAMFSDFGMDRVRGPLYGSATGYFALLPGLGFAVERSLARRSTSARLAVLAFLVAILGMGSRAGVILAGLYLCALAAFRYRRGGRPALLLLIVLCGAISAAAVFARANPGRLRSFDDSGRELTHRMAASYFRHEPLAALAAGAGYGTIWAWYLRDAHHGERVAAGDNLISTPFGPSLYHSHSTALTMAIELGLAGLAAFAWQMAAVGGMALRARRKARWVAFSGAPAVAMLGCFFDLFLFKNTTVNLIWWIYLAALSRLLGEER
jgi:hypothetical protein